MFSSCEVTLTVSVTHLDAFEMKNDPEVQYSLSVKTKCLLVPFFECSVLGFTSQTLLHGAFAQQYPWKRTVIMAMIAFATKKV